jgi:hypothetical protein
MDEHVYRKREENHGLPRAAKPQPKVCQRDTLKKHERTQLIFVSFCLFSGPAKCFAVLVVFCSRFMADQKSSRVATNLAYSSADDADVLGMTRLRAATAWRAKSECRMTNLRGSGGSASPKPITGMVNALGQRVPPRAINYLSPRSEAEADEL